MSMITITVFICIISSVFGQMFCQEGGEGVLLCDSPSGRESGQQKIFSPRAISLLSEAVSFMDTSPPENCVSRVSKRTSEPVACCVIYSVNSVCIALDETCEGHKTVPQKDLKKTLGRQEP